jgi:hypothetical protein
MSEAAEMPVCEEVEKHPHNETNQTQSNHHLSPFGALFALGEEDGKDGKIR